MNQGEVVAQSVFDTSFGGASVSIAKIGQLNPDQANTFIDYVFDQTSISKVCRVIKMNAPQARIGKVGIGDKPLRPATFGVDPGVTSQATVTEINLVTKELIAEAQILDNELEDNTEMGAFMDHFMRMLAIKIGNQLELAYLTGVSTNGTPAAVDINQQFNGWEYLFKNSGGHIVDGSTANALWADRYLNTDKLNKLLKAIPPKYRTRNIDYRYVMSPNIYTDFAALVGARQTPFGDVAFHAAGYETNFPAGQNSVLGWAGIPIYPAPLLPEGEFTPTLGGTSAATTVTSGGAAGTNTVSVAATTNLAVGNVILVDTGAIQEVCTITAIAALVLTVTSLSTTSGNFAYSHAAAAAVVKGSNDASFVMLTHFQNLIVGIQRDIRIELDRRPRERATYAVVTLRVDCNMENTDAGGLLTGLAVK